MARRPYLLVRVCRCAAPDRQKVAKPRGDEVMRCVLRGQPVSKGEPSRDCAPTRNWACWSGRYLGQRLRGSSDFAAWHDSALYLTAARDHVRLTVEHRRARAPEPLSLRLVAEPTPHLQLLNGLGEGSSPAATPSTALEDQILELLRSSPVPLPTRDVRGALSRRKSTVVAALRALSDDGRIERQAGGWSPPAPPPGDHQTLFPCSPH